MEPDATHTGGSKYAFLGTRLRVSSDRIVRAGVLVLVFVLAGVAASGVEFLRVRRAARWRASADLTVSEEWFRIAHGGANGSAALEPSAIAEEVLSGLRRSRSAGTAIAPMRTPEDSQERSATGSDRESIRRHLQVAVDRPGNGMLRIGIAFSAPDQIGAVRQVNDLAVVYAAELRLGLAREVLRRAAEIGTIEERVEGDFSRIKPQLDAIIDRAVSKTTYLQPGGHAPAERSSHKEPTSNSPFVEESAAESQPPASPADRASLQRQLQELKARRDRLLVNRTASHPEVRQLDAQIRDAEQQFAATPPVTIAKPQESPREIAGPETIAVTPPQQPRSTQIGPTQTGSPSTELFQAIQSLQERMEGIARELKQVRAMSIPGAKSLMHGDNLGVQWADHAEVLTARVMWQSLALVALAAGLVAAAGVGMIWAGLAIDQPFETAHSVQQGLMLPVIGTIVVDQLLAGSAAMQVSRARWKWPCVVGGLAVLGAYAVFLVQPFLAG